MDNRIRDTFDKVQAEAALKQKTVEFLHEKIQQKSVSRKVIQFRRTAAFTSFALLLIMGGFSYNLYFTHSAYVDIEVNPSIALAVNRFDRVIAAQPYNDDGAVILQAVSVRHMSYRDATDKLIGAMATSGYLQEDGLVSVTVQVEDENRGNDMLGGLRVTIEQTLQAHHTNAATNVFPVSEEVRSHAHENHVTPAKYLAISALQQVDPTADFADCRERTIGEINQRAEEHSGGHHGNEMNGESNKPHENNREHGGKHH